jgi:hypothetical protein
MASTHILYRRDLRGRVVSIGTAAAPLCFAAFSYRPDGSLAGETLGAGTLARSFERSPTRRLATSTTPLSPSRSAILRGARRPGPMPMGA